MMDQEIQVTGTGRTISQLSGSARSFLWFACVLAFLFFSCSESTGGTDNITKAEDLTAAPTGRITIPEGIKGHYDRVAEATAEIGEKISIIDERLSAGTKTLIVDGNKAEINDLSLLLAEQKERIRELNRALNVSEDLAEDLQDSIEKLNKVILDKNMELLFMIEASQKQDVQLRDLQENVYHLFVESLFKSVKIEDLKDEMQAVYYTIGTRDELVGLGVLKEVSKLKDKAGSRLNEKQDDSNFIRLHAKNTTYIPVYSKNVRLITPHPSASYRLEREENIIRGIEITDPEKFWSTSKYLVIEAGR